MLALTVVGGFLIGSFLNVVIVRLPRRQSLWGPRSACPACGAAIAWHDNIPVLSFVMLRGRCRSCQAPISWRYPVVESATAALFALAYARFGPGPDLVVALVFLAAMIAVTAIDLEHQIIPDAITIPGILAGLLASVATGRLAGLDSVLGVLVGGGIFWVILQASLVFTGREGMGGGDIKLGAMLGAFLGWKVVLLSIFLSVVLGGALALVLLALKVTGRKDPIPFGPFLAAGGVVGLLWGQGLVTWYVSGFGFGG
jgi:leader peptidase (prepilin peptidase)/N-methyltransferase